MNAPNGSEGTRPAFLPAGPVPERQATDSVDRKSGRPAISWTGLLAIFIRLSFRYRAFCTWVAYKSTLRILCLHLFRAEQPGCLRSNIGCNAGCWSSCELLSPSAGKNYDSSACLLWLLMNGDTKPTKRAVTWQDKTGPRALSGFHGVSWEIPKREISASLPHKSSQAEKPRLTQSPQEYCQTPKTLQIQEDAYFLANVPHDLPRKAGGRGALAARVPACRG